MHRYRKNIPLDYLYVGLSTMNLTHGLWMIYLASRGFSLVQLGLLEGIYHVTSFLMEVPTGVVADLWGRKYSRLVGRIIAVFAFAVMFFGRTFWIQAVAFVCTALGNNLESGSGDALVYDSMLLDGREHRYMHVAGRRELVYQGAAIIGFAAGGHLALRSYGAVFFLSMAFSAAAAVCAIFFREPRITQSASAHHGGKTFLHRVGTSMHSQLVDSVAIMRKRGRIAFLIVFSELLFSLITVLFYYLQNHWISLGWSELGIGLVFAANAMVAGAVAFHAPAIERRIGERGVLTWVPLFMLLCLWGIALSPWEQLFFILLGCVEGLLATAIGTYLNRLIPSAQRATILSFQSMVFSLFMIALFPVAGAMGDRWSLKWSFAGMAALAGVLCVCYLVIAKPFASSDR